MGHIELSEGSLKNRNCLAIYVIRDLLIDSGEQLRVSVNTTLRWKDMLNIDKKLMSHYFLPN